MNAPLLLLLASVSFAAPTWHESLPEALADAKSKKAPVLVDFEAPWCYSCYYMQKNVLSKPRFAQAAEKLVLAKLDVDKEEGHALKAKHAVTFLPSYLLLDASGKELGRIIGEQTEADFAAKLEALVGKGAQDDETARALGKLRQRLNKGDLDAYDKLLDAPVSCELAYDVLKAEPLLEKAPARRKEELTAKAKAQLEVLAKEHLFGPEPARCADLRSGVEALIAADPAVKTHALDRAFAVLQVGKKPAGEDRNRDDNVRYFLELKGDEASIRAWYGKLVDAYPSDYVYPYRYAKWLESKGKPGEALPWIEKADRLAYGANRLQVTLVRAKVLSGLGRADEAKKLAQRDLASAKGKFPTLEKPLADWLKAQK